MCRIPCIRQMNCFVEYVVCNCIYCMRVECNHVMYVVCIYIVCVVCMYVLLYAVLWHGRTALPNARV